MENIEQDMFEKNEVDVSNNNKSEYENVNVNDPTTWNLNYKKYQIFSSSTWSRTCRVEEVSFHNLPLL